MALGINAGGLLFQTVLLLDICTITHIKDRVRILNGTDEKKKEKVREILKMIKSGNYQFSFLLAIIEKATDKAHPLDGKQLNYLFQKDFSSLVSIIGSRNMVESTSSLKEMIFILMDKKFSIFERAELSLKSSLELLEFYGTLIISETPAKTERLKIAKKVVDYGKSVGVSPGYPVIVICIASIYGCPDARGILKIRADGTGFNPSNALGDIMSFYRGAKARYELKKRFPWAKVEFRTEDSSLEKIHEYYVAEGIGETSDSTVMKIKHMDPQRLFPSLYKKGECINTKELHTLYNLLDFKYDK